MKQIVRPFENVVLALTVSDYFVPSQRTSRKERWRWSMSKQCNVFIQWLKVWAENSSATKVVLGSFLWPLVSNCRLDVHSKGRKPQGSTGPSGVVPPRFLVGSIESHCQERFDNASPCQEFPAESSPIGARRKVRAQNPLCQCQVDGSSQPITAYQRQWHAVLLNAKLCVWFVICDFAFCSSDSS